MICAGLWNKFHEAICACQIPPSLIVFAVNEMSCPANRSKAINVLSAATDCRNSSVACCE